SLLRELLFGQVQIQPFNTATSRAKRVEARRTAVDAACALVHFRCLRRRGGTGAYCATLARTATHPARLGYWRIALPPPARTHRGARIGHSHAPARGEER